MDAEKIYLTTVYNKDNKLIGLYVHDDLEAVSFKGKLTAEAFGNGATCKVWVCVNTEPISKKAEESK